MSNVIKAYSVRYEDEAKKTIDFHFRIDKEIEMKRINILKGKVSQDGFVEGLNAVAIEELPSAQETSETTSEIIENAQNEAKDIIDKAEKEAEQIKNEAYSTASKKGYEEGALQSKRETQKLAAEYDEKVNKLKKEYEDMAVSMEPQIAQIITALVKKLTGVMVEDKEEVILYLIDKSIKNMDKSNEYTIRVSNDDYEYVSVRKDMILSAIGKNVPLYIIEDAALLKNQCLIETDLHVINCSLDVQLGNLITDLKLLGGI